MSIKSKKDKGFTLVELMVVISIVGFLTSVMFSAFASAKTKAKDSAAISLGLLMSKVIEACDIDGGKVTSPNSTTNPNNNVCSLGPLWGTWQKISTGWVWNTTVWVDGQNNLIHMASTYDGKQIHCGHYPSWTTYYCPPNGGAVHTGLCRLVSGFGCTYFDPATGIWK